LTKPKLCKDCKHCVTTSSGDSMVETIVHFCTVDKREEIDVVSGQVITVGTRNCYDMRREKSKCGLRGKFWEKA
jgi:hypothetical protein